MEPKTTFPSKPTIKSTNIKKRSNKKALCNYYSIKLIHNKSKKQMNVLSWSMILRSEIPLDARRTYDYYVKKYRKQILNEIGYFIPSGQKVYSLGCIDELDKKDKFFKFCDPDDEDGVTLELNLNKDIYNVSTFSSNPQENFELLKMFNLVVKSNLQKMGLQELGKNKKYYDNNPSEVYLGDWAYLVLKGVKSSVGLLESGLKINLDYNVRITRYYNLWEETEFLLDQGKRIDQILEENVYGKSFILLHANHRIVRVNSVDRKMKITDAFPNKNFKNYIEYFEKKYKYRLKDKNQFFCVVIEKQYNINKNKTKNPIKRSKNGKEYIEQENYYPSELLRATGILDSQKNDRSTMQSFAKYTKLKPDQRMERIEEFIEKFNNVDPKSKSRTKDRVIDFGPHVQLKICQETNEVDGIVLDFPAIESGSGKMKPNPKNGNYNMRDKIYSKNVKMNNYALVFDSYQKKNVGKVIDGLKKCSKSYGISVSHPSVEFQIDSRNVDPAELLKKIKKKNKNIEIVLFVVGSRNNIYAPIKNYFAKMKMPTQFFTNLGRINLSVYSKVLLQKAAKIGKKLWKVENAFENKNEYNCLIGVYIIQSKKGMLVSLSASVNKNITTFCSVVDEVSKSTKKGTRELISEKIAQLVGDVYEEFKLKNKRFPDNIMVYRHGSGNSDGLDDDLRYEAIACQEEINEINKSMNKTNLIYFGVSTQITERIFEKDKRFGAKNPNGGLIVCKGINRQDRFEFLMVAQNVNQGSATPTKYNCVYNNTQLTEDEIIKTTYYQTFNYANWQGPVKVPSVCMYSQKCAQYWADNLKFRKNSFSKLFEIGNLYFL